MSKEATKTNWHTVYRWACVGLMLVGWFTCIWVVVSQR